MATALQLVNRVRRLMRFDDAPATFDPNDELTKVILDLINEAKNDILESRVWDFDVRHDGVLRLRPEITATVILAEGISTFLFATLTAAQIKDWSGILDDNVVIRLVPTSATDFGSTAFKVKTIINPVAASTNGTLQNAYPGALVASTAAQMIVSEYGLPGTVRAIFQARHQESDCAITQINSTTQFEEFYAQQSRETSDRPYTIAIGGQITPTYATTGTEPDPVDRVIVYPAPSEPMQIDYSYVYRHPELASSTDELESVDTPVENVIVRLAYARALMSSVGNDLQRGVALETESLMRAEKLHMGLKRSKQTRAILSPFSRRSSSRDFGTLPRNYGSL